MDLNTFYLIASISLTLLNILQFFQNKEKTDTIRNLTRSWQNHAEGLKNSLLNIAYGSEKFTNKSDVAAAIEAVAQNAVALDKALIQQRFNSDKEVKKKIEESEKATQAMFQTKSEQPT